MQTIAKNILYMHTTYTIYEPNDNIKSLLKYKQTQTFPEVHYIIYSKTI